MDTRPDPRPRTRTTGVLPLRPLVLARGGVIDWRASPSKTTQPLFAAAVLLPAAAPLVSTTPPRRCHARSRAGSAAARTSHGAAEVATFPPRCTRRGTAGRSPSSHGPASIAGRPTRVPADRAPTPSPTWLSARQIARVDRVTPWRPFRRGRPRATGVANAPPTVPRPAAWQRSHGSSSKHVTAWRRTRSRASLSTSVKSPPCVYLTERGLPRPPSGCLANSPTSPDQVQ